MTKRIYAATLEHYKKTAAIGIITALSKEHAAVAMMLTNLRDEMIGENRYTMGEIPAVNGGVHYIALALLPDMGNGISASAATQMLIDFPNLKHIIMCGIAGGVFDRNKQEHDIRLGDIVVLNRAGVVNYGRIAENSGGKKEARHSPLDPSRFLLSAVRHLQSYEDRTRRQPWLKFLDVIPSNEKNEIWKRPDDNANADPKKPPITYPDCDLRKKGIPRVFYGAIASSDTLLKNSERRDELASEFAIKAVEMEGSGVAEACWNSGKAAYFVVRGVCDYCDDDKGDVWQYPAALAAAAYTRALIESIPGGALPIFKTQDNSNETSMINDLQTQEGIFDGLVNTQNAETTINFINGSMESSQLNNIECTFIYDDICKLDTAISSRTEISEIHQAFSDGYKIIVLWGLPDCGKSYIAHTYANTHREQFPIVKSLVLKRVSKGQNLAALVISARAWYFDKGIGDTGTPEEQFNDKLLAFNKVNQGKLIIISGINEINKEDIESLKELKSNFIICTESNIAAPSVKTIPVKTISYDEALKLFKLYNDTEIQEDSLKDVFAMLEYHVGLIRFIAKQMQQYPLSATDVKEKFNTSDVTRKRVDIGLDALTLAEYCKALFSFSDLSKEDISLLTMISLLPAQNHSIAFFEEYFHRPKLELINDAIPLSKKGYINYDTNSQTIKPSFLVAKAFLESDLFDVDIAKDVLKNICDILEREGCKDFSVIQDKLNYGVVAAEKLSSINSFDDADLCLKIASGYKDLCFIDDAQKYAEMAMQLRKDKKTTLQVMHFKVDIMIFRFDYRSTVDYLESQIKQVIWEDFSNKEKGEILYKIGLVYNFLNLYDKSSEYFKRGFQAFKEDECIVGEFVCIGALLRSSIDNRVYRKELEMFIEDGISLFEVDPFWSFIAYVLQSPIGGLVADAKFNIRNISLEKIIDTINGMGIFQVQTFENKLEEILSHIKKKADEGNTLECAVADFVEVGTKAIENYFSGKDVDADIVINSLVRYMSEALNKLRELNIPLNTEIEMLQMFNGGFLKEMKLIDDSVLEAKVLQLFEQRYSDLLPTSNERLLATQSYAKIAPLQKGVLELEEQIGVLENHLPKEHRYPLATLYETLAYRYSDLNIETKEREYSQKCTKCIINSIDVLKTISDTHETQARLYYYIRDYDAAINTLEENNIISCQLCTIYCKKAIELLQNDLLTNETIEYITLCYEKLQFFRHDISICNGKCYASILFDIGNKFSIKREHCSETEYAAMVKSAFEKQGDFVSLTYYDASDDNELKSPSFWYQKATEVEHFEAQYEMGIRYYFGNGVMQSYEKSVELFQKAAEQNHYESQHYLGLCYYFGKGVVQSYEKSEEWFRKSAEQGYAQAQYEMGHCYARGDYLNKDYSKAAEWYSKAAEQGHRDSLYELGKYYYSGIGIEQNTKIAIDYFEKAIAQGHIEAKREKEKCYYNVDYSNEGQDTRIDDIYQYLQGLSCIGKVYPAENGDIIIQTGCAYNDMTEMLIRINTTENIIILTDDGRAHSYLDTIFELSNPDVVKNISAITNYFGMKYENKIFSIEVDEISKISESVLKLYYGIGFLNTMKIFYALGGA